MTGVEKEAIERSERNKAQLSTELQARWLVEQTAAIRAAEERIEVEIARLDETKRELARFIARHSTPEAWGLLPREVADEVISCLPREGGYFGLEPEEGDTLHAQWLERTGIESSDLIVVK